MSIKVFMEEFGYTEGVCEYGIIKSGDIIANSRSLRTVLNEFAQWMLTNKDPLYDVKVAKSESTKHHLNSQISGKQKEINRLLKENLELENKLASLTASYEPTKRSLELMTAEKSKLMRKLKRKGLDKEFL